MKNRVIRKFGFRIFPEQQVLIPTFGIIYGNNQYKFAIGFLWLNMAFCIRFFRARESEQE